MARMATEAAMMLGIVLIGMAAGLCSGLALWAAGAGLGMAFVAYMGCGALGMVLAVALILAGQGARGLAARLYP
ncbi:MAG: hypothetical protein B7Y02_10385 [Rhodobacterales bacterium 17-64-5]|nr:MAG: hypothetical protein B7Y02_10385 [Rhodobacterales bacterium 17-64-5]